MEFRDVVDYRLAGLQKMQIVNFEAETLKTDEVLYRRLDATPLNWISYIPTPDIIPIRKSV